MVGGDDARSEGYGGGGVGYAVFACCGGGEELDVGVLGVAEPESKGLVWAH